MLQQKKHKKPNYHWNLEDIILLNSDSTIKGTFINTNLVTNIKHRKNPLHVSNNAGTKK